LAQYDDSMCYPVRGRQCSAQQIPELGQRFPTYDLFGRCTVDQVYGKAALSASDHLSAFTFATCVLLGDGKGGFTMKALTNEAQFSSVNGIAIEDFTGDGFTDILLAGNQWDFEVETPRNDASTGVLLAGDGRGSFAHVPSSRSGLRLTGNVKGLASILLANGAKGIVVTNNDGPLRIIATTRR
jgi:hypothetical protein